MSTVDASKITRDIADLKGKKQTLLLSLQNDVEAIENEMKEEFCKIGQMAYELAAKGEESLGALADEFAIVDRCKQDQEAKAKKMADIAERYDEEITILEKLVPNIPAPAAPSGGSACPKCGTPCIAGVDMFCKECGSRLGA